MIGKKQRTIFLSVGAISFLLGALLLILWRFNGEFALLVMGPCFMLTGVTWTVVIMLAFRSVGMPKPAPIPPPKPMAERGGRVRLTESGFVDPVHCFCDLSEAEMRPWVNRRYVDHVPTMELLQAAQTAHEKEVVSLVAMLDVDDETLLGVMCDVEQTREHILACRNKARRMLELE